MSEYRYDRHRRDPVEVLVFRVDPDHVDRFLEIDHEVWTLGEALLPGFDQIPFRSKEVWLDDTRPGVITLVFVWESHEDWDRVGATDVQDRLQSEFDERFGHPVELLRAYHDESDHGIHRWSRFERVDPV
ncbi:MAG: TIGR03792 family protein [Actinomycetota bacterium]